jgi:predicted metalloprotease with PDZ domain
VLQRAGIADLASMAGTLTGLVEAVSHTYANQVRSATQMSEMAPFIDGGQPIDRTNFSTTVISYYPFGGAIALALDLSLRDRSDGRVSLDDFMRAMWRKFGKPGAAREGIVETPYTLADAEATLAEVAGDAAFARNFFAKYIEGHDVADYSRLLARAGFVVRKRNAGRAWLGDIALQGKGEPRVARLVSPVWPIYKAGIEQDDRLQQIDGKAISGDDDVAAAIAQRKPGDTVSIVFIDRAGESKTASITLAEDPHLEVVPAETAGVAVTPAQHQFRDRWLKSRL